MVAIGFCCLRIGALEARKAELKRDKVEISHVKYGLFNVDEWKRIIAEVITKKIRELKITKENRPEMKRKIEDLLYSVVDQLDQDIQQRGSRSIAGFFQSLISDLVGVTHRMRERVPHFADQVLEFLNDPRNREELRGYLIKQFNDMADKTVGQVDYSKYDDIMAKYGAASKEMFLTNVDFQTERINRNELVFIYLLVVAMARLLTLLLAGGDCSAPDLGIMVACAAMLLLAGLAMPMIDIEATISSFSFKLVGEPVEFKDQVLFFQSKSILQVVWLLLKNGGFGLVLVSFLVFAFSVLFPISKLIATIISIMQNRRPTHWLHRFLVFKSGKWSMADVMVVAIFMSYIGFNGVINSQLTQITAASSNVQVFTTNDSELKAGFYLFASYCLIGLLLSMMVERRMMKQALIEE